METKRLLPLKANNPIARRRQAKLRPLIDFKKDVVNLPDGTTGELSLLTQHMGSGLLWIDLLDGPQLFGLRNHVAIISSTEEADAAERTWTETVQAGDSLRIVHRRRATYYVEDRIHLTHDFIADAILRAALGIVGIDAGDLFKPLQNLPEDKADGVRLVRSAVSWAMRSRGMTIDQCAAVLPWGRGPGSGLPIPGAAELVPQILHRAGLRSAS